MLPSLINREYGSTTSLGKSPWLVPTCPQSTWNSLGNLTEFCLFWTGKEKFSVDFLLSKLKCHQDDEYPGIFSTSNSAPSSDLLYACKFAQSPGFEHIVALANEDGKIALQDTNIVGKSRPIIGFQAHENAIFDLCWAPSSWQIITASGDQTSILFDIGTSSINPISIFRGHSASIKSVDFSPTNSGIDSQKNTLWIVYLMVAISIGFCSSVCFWFSWWIHNGMGCSRKYPFKSWKCH